MTQSGINRSALAVLLLLFIVFTTISSCDKESDIEKQAGIDRELIEKYVSQHNLNGKFTISGLYYVILEQGDGTYPQGNPLVKVTYKGYLLDETVFEEDHIPLIQLSGLILGWQEGIKLIDKGGSIQLIIPSGLAYGSDQSEKIPANSVLVFDITLHDFE